MSSNSSNSALFRRTWLAIFMRKRSSFFLSWSKPTPWWNSPAEAFSQRSQKLRWLEPFRVSFLDA